MLILFPKARREEIENDNDTGVEEDNNEDIEESVLPQIRSKKRKHGSKVILRHIFYDSRITRYYIRATKIHQ